MTARRGLPLCSHTIVEGNVDSIGAGVVPDGKAKISNCAFSVLLDENVLRFQVSVGDWRFTCRKHLNYTESTLKNKLKITGEYLLIYALKHMLQIIFFQKNSVHFHSSNFLKYKNNVIMTNIMFNCLHNSYAALKEKR